MNISISDLDNFTQVLPYTFWIENVISSQWLIEQTNQGYTAVYILKSNQNSVRMCEFRVFLLTRKQTTIFRKYCATHHVEWYAGLHWIVRNMTGLS